MEQTTLSSKNVENEINLCEEIIEQFEKSLEELLEKAKQLSGRLDVLRSVETKLPNNSTKALVQANIQMVVDERFALAPEISRQHSHINHYTEILDKLYEIKSEVE